MSEEEDFMGGFGAPSSEEEEKKEKKEEKKGGGKEEKKEEAKAPAAGGSAPAPSGRVGPVSEDYKPIILKPQKDQMGCIFAALLLHGDGDSSVEITSDKLTNILRAAKIEANPFFPSLYAKILKSVDIKDLILSGALSGGGSGGSAAPVAAGGSSAPAATGGNAPTAEKKEEKKEKEEEPEEQSIGGLFGSEDE